MTRNIHALGTFFDRLILDELTASGYAWYPRIDGLALRDDQEKRLAAFILGGMLFWRVRASGGY